MKQRHSSRMEKHTIVFASPLILELSRLPPPPPLTKILNETLLVHARRVNMSHIRGT